MRTRSTRIALVLALFISSASHAQESAAQDPGAETITAPADTSIPVPVGDQAAEGPILSGNNATVIDVSHQPQLLVFKGTTLLNEFVYRAMLKIPPDAKATPAFARDIAQQLAGFLGAAGYELAKVRAKVVSEHVEVSIDEGALDKVIVSGGGWITALRFRAALNLPLDVFNRRLFEMQLPHLARQFGFRTYRYELWPVHLLDVDNGEALDDIEELRAMPLLHAAKGYELRIFGVTEQWSSGFSPEVVINGAIGFGIGGRYRWKDVIQDGDRWQMHVRFGGALRGSLDTDGGTAPVNTEDYLSARWLSKPWGGSASGLRMTIAPHVDLWQLQRPDLELQSYRIGTMELGVGAGSQLSRELSLYFTLGVQRRWIFDVDPAVINGVTITPVADVTSVPAVSNRGFLRANSQYTFNPNELRQDERDFVTLDIDAFQPTFANTKGYFRFDAQGKKLIAFGWNELRLGGRITGEAGDVLYVDEMPLSDHLRLGFGLVKYTQRMGTLSLEYRYSLLRDKVKVGLFTDVGVWRELPRVDPDQSAKLAGSSGGGLFFFVFDELQIDIFYGVGWATDNFLQTGFALAIKEAF